MLACTTAGGVKVSRGVCWVFEWCVWEVMPCTAVKVTRICWLFGADATLCADCQIAALVGLFVVDVRLWNGNRILKEKRTKRLCQSHQLSKVSGTLCGSKRVDKTGAQNPMCNRTLLPLTIGMFGATPFSPRSSFKLGPLIFCFNVISGLHTKRKKKRRGKVN